MPSILYRQQIWMLNNYMQRHLKLDTKSWLHMPLILIWIKDNLQEAIEEITRSWRIRISQQTTVAHPCVFIIIGDRTYKFFQADSQSARSLSLLKNIVSKKSWTAWSCEGTAVRNASKWDCNKGSKVLFVAAIISRRIYKVKVPIISKKLITKLY